MEGTAKTRPSGLLIITGLLALLSLFFLLMGGSVVWESVGRLFEEPGGGDEAFRIVIASLGMVLGAAILAVGLAAGLFLRSFWRYRSWARKGVVGLAILLGAFFGMLALSRTGAGDAASTVYLLPWAALAGWVFWYLNRRDIAARFKPSSPAAAGTGGEPGGGPIESA